MMEQIKRSSRSGEYIRWRLRVSDAYRKAGMPDDAKNFEDCSDPSQFFFLKMGDEMPPQAINAVVCSSDPAHLSKAICPSCQLRTCPDCAHREASRLLARYMPTMQQYVERPFRPDWKFRKFVFTTGISLLDDDVRGQVKALYASLRKVFETALKARYQGPIAISDVGILVDHEFGPNGTKVHFHGIYYGPWIEQEDLSRLWATLTGWNVVRIYGIGKSKLGGDLASAVAEVLKYTTKFWKREKSGKVVFVEPDLVPILHKVLHGTRRVRSWGLFYGIQQPEEQVFCPDCGAPLALLSRTEWDAWSQTGWTPLELTKVLRGDSLLSLIHGNKSPPIALPIGHTQEHLL